MNIKSESMMTAICMRGRDRNTNTETGSRANRGMKRVGKEEAGDDTADRPADSDDDCFKKHLNKNKQSMKDTPKGDCGDHAHTRFRISKEQVLFVIVSVQSIDTRPVLEARRKRERERANERYGVSS
jgi:hypothetical protein